MTYWKVLRPCALWRVIAGVRTAHGCTPRHAERHVSDRARPDLVRQLLLQLRGCGVAAVGGSCGAGCCMFKVAPVVRQERLLGRHREWSTVAKAVPIADDAAKFHAGPTHTPTQACGGIARQLAQTARSAKQAGGHSDTHTHTGGHSDTHSDMLLLLLHLLLLLLLLLLLPQVSTLHTLHVHASRPQREGRCERFATSQALPASSHLCQLRQHLRLATVNRSFIKARSAVAAASAVSLVDLLPALLAPDARSEGNKLDDAVAVRFGSHVGCMCGAHDGCCPPVVLATPPSTTCLLRYRPTSQLATPV
jgi:hypothetical protein